MLRPLIAFCLILPAALAVVAQADELSNHTFQIQYDANGIRSLRRTNDVHDTDYIAPDGTLGPPLIRYRTTRHGDWRTLNRLLPRTPSSPSAIEYVVGALAPSLAEKASPSAERGVGGLRALNDGIVPAAPSTALIGSPSPPVPVFSWTPGPNEPGSGGPGGPARTRWVQYAFPAEEAVSRAEVYWVRPPQSWRLLYQDGREWKEVAAAGAYGAAADALASVEFAQVTTLALRLEVTMPPTGLVSLAEWRVGSAPQPTAATDLSAVVRFALVDDVLEWTIALSNETAQPIELGDLALPLNFAERVVPKTDIYTRKLLRHALVAGHGSWIYWQRSNGEGPFLVMTPTNAAKFEYFETSSAATGGGPPVFTPYVHAGAASAAATAAGGHWRLPVSGLTLSPKGEHASSAVYSFRFRWAANVSAVRDVLYDQHKLDTVVVPGMVVPIDLPASIALRTRNAIQTIEAEHPSRTIIESAERQPGDVAVYRVHFSKLGENTLTVRYGDGRWTTLEFFVTEPLEALVRKRAAFLVNRHQHKDPRTWYVGTYGDWDQKNEILRGPEDRDALPTWVTDANDDAGNARPAFIASKNVFFPERAEIESLELYIEKYLWGSMQMTDVEKYPYALYGIPNWKANRVSPDEGRNGRAHVWRIYDYPHIVMLYLRMHQIAKFYPDMVTHLDASRYLERAYRTAVAYWTVPMAVEKWSADSVGTMNEACIPELIDTLESEGRRDWAATLRGHWERKVERFVNRPPNLYGSEFAFDSTGFESTGAFAKYALTHQIAGVTPDAAERFMDFQLRLNMTDRGWLETTYYQLGSDYRGNLTYLLSYMSPMGGWAILDYALHFARDPTDYLRLGYASALSAWALVNSGTKETGFGYWFPSPNNDGAAGGGFMPEARGRAWIGKQVSRGAWSYSAETDVGFTGALRAHATIVTRDPIFGEIAYGGVLTRKAGSVHVVPHDGLRVRFHVVRADQRLHLELDHDGFASDQPIVVADDLSRIEFALENRAGRAHSTRLAVSGLPAGRYQVIVDGRRVATLDGPDHVTVALPVDDGPLARVVIARP